MGQTRDKVISDWISIVIGRLITHSHTRGGSGDWGRSCPAETHSPFAVASPALGRVDCAQLAHREGGVRYGRRGECVCSGNCATSSLSLTHSSRCLSLSLTVFFLDIFCCFSFCFLLIYCQDLSSTYSSPSSSLSRFHVLALAFAYHITPPPFSLCFFFSTVFGLFIALSQG